MRSSQFSDEKLELVQLYKRVPHENATHATRSVARQESILKANTIKYPPIGRNETRRLQELSITTTSVYNPFCSGTVQVVSGPLFYWPISTHHLRLMGAGHLRSIVQPLQRAQLQSDAFSSAGNLHAGSVV